MSDGHRKSNKQYPGSVPKVKYSNNTCSRNDERRSNAPSTSWHFFPDSTNFIRNPRRLQGNNHFMMDIVLDQPNVTSDVRNGIVGYPNGNITTPGTSSSTSRRNSTSSVLKCDNVTKYPDKKQIEDKLCQIREYLQIINSMMINAKNVEEQISGNVENGLENDAGPSRRNDSDVNVLDNQELDFLREQQLSLLKLQQKAENRLRDARLVQEKMFAQAGTSNEINLSNQKDNKNMSLSDFDAAIKELEERAKHLHPTRQTMNTSDRLMHEVESLQNKIIDMRTANNEREQLIQVLDSRDTELKSQQAELQSKLAELQTKKNQVDQLAVQLQAYDEDDEDVGIQVRKIVTMKDQLTKLKDMLEIVKTTENAMMGGNVSSEARTAANEICQTAEHFLQNQFEKARVGQSDGNNGMRFENNTSAEGRQKQTNTNSRIQNLPRNKSSAGSINEKIALQAELEAKKKELEEIMGKHKAGTSNLNHDIGNDSKSEYSCVSNSVPMNERYWKSSMPSHSRDQGSEAFSSDECDENEYSEVHENANLLPSHQVNYFPVNLSKPRCDSEYDISTEQLHSFSHTPDRNIRSISVTASDLVREQSITNNIDQEKLHKQLQLIKSVCDSMMEQQTNASQQQPVFQQVRNNITPSSGYAETQRYSANAVLNTEVPWYSGQNINGQNDITNYPNWLATNTLQTQSFMLNTLNQCCQMLWLQQRELVALRNSVTALQEKIESPYHNQEHQPVPPAPHHPSPLDHNRASNLFRPNVAQKTNQVSAAYSMPNLNHYNVAHSNIDIPYANLNNVSSSRLLDSCLNNTGPSVIAVDHSNNMLHAMNSNMSHHVWNGQALNNQVAPGNRANNYWDNFRSYSRQNLLSTKNSECFQNSGSERTNPFAVPSTSKSNSEHSPGTSHENTPQRNVIYNLPTHLPNVKIPTVPPDVLNVNQSASTSKLYDRGEYSAGSTQGQTDAADGGLHALLNLNSLNESSSASDGHQCKFESHNSDFQSKKNKSFDELKENVYREVCSLISANEAQPHFLIQLFRDLQKIGSDSLRFKILQSVQNILTQSLAIQPTSNRQGRESDVLVPPESFHLHSAFLSMPPTAAGCVERDELLIKNFSKEILSFLEVHDSDIVSSLFLGNLKQMFMGLESFRDTLKDTVFQRHFSNVLDEVLEQYHGKRVHDVRGHLIQTLRDLLQGELSFIHLIQEANFDGNLQPERKDSSHSSMSFNADSVLFSSPGPSQNVESNIQNGDLAEADQSRVEESDTEEVGLFEPNEIVVEANVEEVLNIQDFSSQNEGLDQVPTRLLTKSKSRSTTPIKDRPTSSQLDHQEPY
ncbi:pericentriolar material 1 protein isoform X2 [Cylas formicarius]|uniref:pericentriolar material 1 protein isoform X2 n=1 Tax=Cylas formicarius TaxID=197179 RepID=UPI0029589F4E|nr:pericentriolar material 1 protein isoform X2 [Cylas formicarius]